MVREGVPSAPAPAASPGSEAGDYPDESRWSILERRLEELERRWPARQGPPSIPEPPESPAELSIWQRRLHETVSSLAEENARLQAQMATLVSLMEHEDERHSPSLGAAVPEPLRAPAPAASPAQRAARLATAAVRLGRAAFRRLWRSGIPDDFVVRAATDRSPTSLRPALLLTPPAEVTSSSLGHEVLLWDPEAAHLRVIDAEGQQTYDGPAPDLAAVVSASESDVVCAVTTSAAEHLTPGTLQLVLHVMAVEDLAFLHLRLPAGHDLLFLRWAWTSWSTDGLALDGKRLAAAPRGRILGRSLGLGGAPPPPLPLAAADHLRGVEGRWLSNRGRKRPIRHERALAPPSQSDPPNAAPATAIVLTRSLGGGLERVVAEILRHEGRDRATLLFQLADEGLFPAHPVATLRSPRGAAPEPPLVWPVGDFTDPEDRVHVARQLLGRHIVDRLLLVGPECRLPDGSDPASLAGTVRHLAVADPRHPHLPAEEAGQVLPPSLASSPLELPPAAETRARLGLPADATVVVVLGDLGLDERPEDALSIFSHLSDRPGAESLYLLFAGRGPLAGTLDDMARFLGVERYLRRDVGAAEGLAVCDLALTTAERPPMPWGVVNAARHGHPVLVVSNDSRLAPLEACGRRVPAGCFEDAADAVLELTGDAELRRRLGARGPEIAASFEDPGWLERLWA